MSESMSHGEVPEDLLAAFPDVAPPEESVSTAGEDTSRGAASGLDALRASIQDTPARARLSELSTRTRRTLAGVLVLLLAGIVLLATRRPDLGVYPGVRMVLDLGLLLIPLGFALIAFLRPLTQPELASWKRALLMVGGVVAVVLLAGLPAAHHDHPASLEGIGEDFIPRARACFMFGTAFTALALFGLGALSRSRWWLPGSLGIWASGLIGLIALYFHCPITHPSHLLFGHATVVLPVLALAWLLRRRIDG